MKIAAEHEKDFKAMPAPLQRLLKAELAAGNKIVEVGHSFPAPPAGAYFKLAKQVSTRERKSSRAIVFYDRNSSIYSGEFTDEKRFYFIIEPPNPPPPEPDMNAIRAAIEAKQRASDEELFKKQRAQAKRGRKAAEKEQVFQSSPIPPRPSGPPLVETTLDRFRGSMTMNYERWHDGIGYDLDLLKKATPEELVEIENFLVNRPVEDWRDVEALAELDSPRARALLRKTLKSGKKSLRTAVADYAPHLVNDEERTEALVAALKETEIYGGLTQALLQVEEFHPAPVIDALFQGVLSRDGETACHFAAMLMFLHGKAKSSFDWEQRPFFLGFNTDDRSERLLIFYKLCSKIGVEPETYLK